ncbi:MAG: hypothetical protein PHI79_03455 [Sulfurovaceae bacterium]|nr:hypothetical protein [Sulfurovaceae bacterium]
MKNLKRIWLEIVISFLILALFFSGEYEAIPPALQLLSLKIGLVSVGILHAHIIGKLIIPVRVDWSGLLIPAHYVRMVLYAIIPICYAFGG